MAISPRLQYLFLFSVLVQLLFCLTQVGYLHPDQHFQLIEFSSWQLGEPSGATSVWELNSHIRPTLQVYLFSGFVKLCRFCYVYDAYTQLTIVRILTGLFSFTLFNALALYYFKSDKKLLYLVLLLLNVSWSLPYVRTLFSSELASSIAFFGGIFLYETRKDRVWAILLTGFLFSLAFYFRFQIAFGLIGFGLWMLLIEKKYTRLLPMAIGFGLGIGLNIFLDYLFYHQFVFTPYEYYRVNITEGKAAEFGTSSFLNYVFMLALVIGAPPLSIFLFYYAVQGAVKEYRQPLVFAVLFFVVGHCLVGHKEERFLFPIVNVLPILAGWGLSSFIGYYQQASARIRSLLKGVTYFSVCLNGLALAFLALNPYSQSIEFSRRVTNTFRGTTSMVYCLKRTPFETESGLPLTFYRRNAPNIKLTKFHEADSARYLKNAWLVTTYNDAKDKLPLLDSLGFKPQLYSSSTLWKLNEFLQKQNINTINEIWVLYRKEE
ncbi:glycosyltransferase family protein [Spirosoma fluminis]